ncbi:Methyltransferase [Gracilaria domingensis]|nr:Methyltransferase [Gracilaria domingensis]
MLTTLPNHLRNYLPIYLWRILSPDNASKGQAFVPPNFEEGLSDQVEEDSIDAAATGRQQVHDYSNTVRLDTKVVEDREIMETIRQAPNKIVGETEGSTGPVMLDKEKAQLFGSRMLSYLNSGSLTLLISIGHKLGLFEVMARLPAVTSVELAQTSDLNERYVREWLSAMYVGGIVDIDDQRNKQQENRYFLPREHAAFLTWGRGPENVAVLTQYISILSSFEDRAVECFRNGKGISCSEYGELKSIMAADSAQTIASSLIGWILPLGQTMIVQGLQAGIDVLDVECGTGINLMTMAKEFPKSWFTGYDTNPALIAAAKEAAEKEKLQNVRFKCSQITESSESSAYDLVTCFGGLIETGDVKNVVRRVYQALRRGGTFLLQDVAANSDVRANRSHPAGCLLYSISLMFSLPTTISKTGREEDALGVMWGNDVALSLLRDVGFKCEGVKRLADDNCNAFLFCSRD